MHTFTQQIDSPSEKVAKLRYDALWHPLAMLVGRINVNEFYPNKPHIIHDNKHEIDGMVFSLVDEVNDKYAYRQLNHFATEKVMLGFYEHVNSCISLFRVMLGPVVKMYGAIRRMTMHRYELLDYPDGPTKLGHVTQLFPVLENAIREMGEYYLISPFRLEVSSLGMLKDTSRILHEILRTSLDVTGTLGGVNDLLFVYHVMFSRNGFNIRNACIHGESFQAGERVHEAFTLTVFCVYTILWRLDYLRSAENDIGENSLIW